MKKSFVTLLMLSALAMPSYAAVGAKVSEPPYVVQSGDTAWEIAGTKLHDPYLWKKVVKMNPILQQKGREFDRSGKHIVLMHPGEKLYGLAELGIVPHKVTLPIIKAQVNQASSWQVPADPSWFDEHPWWPWALLVLLAGGAIAYGVSQLRRDPATSGPPIIEGGVTVADAPDRFLQMAANAYRSRTGTQAATQNFRIVGDVVAGRGDGLMGINYRDGKPRLRLLVNEPMYRALVQHPDGTREDLYMLQRCGNDLLFGGVYRYVPRLGFRFTPDGQVAEQAAAVPTAEVPPAAEPTSQPLHPDKRVVVEILPPDGEHETSMMRLKGVDASKPVSYDVDNHDIVTIRFVPLLAGA